MKKKQTPYDGKYGPPIDLREIETQVLAEGQEWMRRRMEDLLQERAKAFSPRSERLPSGRATTRIDAEDPNRGDCPSR